MTASRRRRATARTICRAAVATGTTRAFGDPPAASACHRPRLSTWRISLPTRPGLTSVTATPRGPSSWASASARPRTANLTIADAGQSQRPAPEVPDVGRELLEPVHAPRGQRQIGARARELAGERLADAGRRARDEDDLARESRAPQASSLMRRLRGPIRTPPRF